MSIAKQGRPICSLDDWRDQAPPKSLSQWVDFRSAKELARVWLPLRPPAIPPEFEALLRTDPAFGSVLGWTAEPEARVRFDRLRGEPRNTDLLVHVTDELGAFVMSVEAKADEAFGETVARAAAHAAQRRDKNPRSRGTERLAALCQTLFGSTLEAEPGLGALRYQLLTATAGAIAAAAQAGVRRAVIVVQEFRSSHTSAARHAANARELDEFVGRLTNSATERVTQGRLHRLPPLPAAPLFEALPALFLGKVTRELATETMVPTQCSTVDDT